MSYSEVPLGVYQTTSWSDMQLHSMVRQELHFMVRHAITLLGQTVNCITWSQRHQSGLKSGGHGSGSTKVRFFPKKFREILNFFQPMSQKISIFPGKFLKNFDFSRQF